MNRRPDTTAMLRLKNEGHWIRKHMARTWAVARNVVVFDDNSTDNTIAEVKASFPEWTQSKGFFDYGGATCEVLTTDLYQLHIIQSPFTGLDEVRDKNLMWQYVADTCKPKYVLALDGDEMLSRLALREWSSALDLLDKGQQGLMLPFIYMWDSEKQRRIDGVYREIWHGRLATTQGRKLSDLKFKSRGYGGGFHCGSIPDPTVFTHRFNAPVIHYGYMDAEVRQRKFEWYTGIDPNNKVEGGYKHMIGQKNHLCPTEVATAPWDDS